MTQTLTLTDDQHTALDAFLQFMTDPKETVFVLSGYSGCGKSTLVKTLLDRIPEFQTKIRLIDPTHKSYAVALAATTNKAAENLQQITGNECSTIHSMLGIRVKTDYITGKTSLMVGPGAYNDKLTRTILFIDEASYIDKELLALIFKLTSDCKIVFVGDPAQLAPIKSSHTPVFDAGFMGAALTKVVRQSEGNPIVTFSTNFRHTVNTGEWLQFTPDNHHVKHLSKEDFMKEIELEFSRLDWKYTDSKILAWTNKTVVGYNHFVSQLVKGTPKFQNGDYAVCNSFVKKGRTSIKTEELVCITDHCLDTRHNVTGTRYVLDGTHSFFMPWEKAHKEQRLKEARANDEIEIAMEIEDEWIDLRAAYAQTVNKSQGSTYDKVFIDLSDLNKCRNGDTLARMLYVAISRARNQVILTGDIC